MTTLPDYEAFARAYISRRGGSRGHDAGRRPRDAGLGLSQARARASRQHVPARIGRGRGAARPLFDDRPRSRPHLPLDRRRRRDQPPGAHRSRRLRPLPRRSARRLAFAAQGIAHRHAARPAADVGGDIRLSRLRHGAAHGAPRARQARPDRRARRPAHPPDRHGGVRRRARRDGDRDAGAACARRLRPRRLRERHGAARRGGRRARAAARSRGRHGRRSAGASGRGQVEHDRGRIQGDGRARQGLYRRGRRVPDRAVAALHQPLRPAGLRALPGAAAGQSRRPISASSISAPSRSSARARRSWCACATARW